MQTHVYGKCLMYMSTHQHAAAARSQPEERLKVSGHPAELADVLPSHPARGDHNPDAWHR